MRRTRRLFLVAIVAILAGVGVSFYVQRELQGRTAPQAPAALASHLSAASRDWVYRRDDGDVPIVELRAREMNRVEEPEAKVLLTGVEMRLFHKGGTEFDLIQTANAEFDEQSGALHSPGELVMTLAVPADAEPSAKMVRITARQVTVDAQSGLAKTPDVVRFALDIGDGEGRGATYDPRSRELLLHADARLRWRGRGEKPRVMNIEAGSLRYPEAESKVYLDGGVSFTRESLAMRAASSVMTLNSGAIERVEAPQASGTDKYPNRELNFGAADLRMEFAEGSVIRKISGEGSAYLLASTATANTRTEATRLDLDFDTSSGESVLTTALATGAAKLESVPVPRAGTPAPPTRILRSEVVLTHMRAGGEAVEKIETHTPGELDLVPNRAGQPKRHVRAERMTMAFADANRLQSFLAVDATTTTHKPATPKKPRPAPAITSSKGLTAQFDPKSGEMTRLEQWDNFRYREGEQQATAEKAVLEPAADRITLERGGSEAARVWDPTGTVTADRVVLNEENGDFDATGNVNSTRMPDPKPKAAKSGAPPSGGMIRENEPLHAKAREMSVRDENRVITYTGEAVLWQSSNRLQADQVVIRRADRTLSATADGGRQIVSQLVESKAPSKGRPATTVVRASSVNYNDAERLAHYRGGVRLIRGTMDVKSRELRAWLTEDKDGNSSLDRAFADGTVEILDTSGGRTRHGSSEHAEYYAAEGKVDLTGGHPQVRDSVKGTSRGRRLTYWAQNDNLQVEGAETQPAVSRIRRN